MARRADDFSEAVRRSIAHRAGYRCSDPDCRASTAGPSNEHPAAITNVGVAAHIVAASEGGPRFDRNMLPEERRSERNGIWLCQTHGKEVDDDSSRFDVETLRAWKVVAETFARSLLGRPFAAEKFEVSLEVSLHRGADDGLFVSGLSNLPAGTKLMVSLIRRATREVLGQSNAVVIEPGTFLAGSLRNGATPWAHACYVVDVVAYFNDAWDQPAATHAISGKNGAEIRGRFVEPLHPELPDEGNIVHAEFECVPLPPSVRAQLSERDGDAAIARVKQTPARIDPDEQPETIEAKVRWFMGAPGLREGEGWSAAILPNSSFAVSYSFWDGDHPATATWNVVLDSGDVRYLTLHAKYFS